MGSPTARTDIRFEDDLARVRQQARLMLAAEGAQPT